MEFRGALTPFDPSRQIQSSFTCIDDENSG